MRHPMDRSQRLTDGTRWRTFMRLLRLDDLMTSYTNARPGAGLLVVDLLVVDLGPRHGLRTPRVTVPHLADAARLVYQLDGSRHAVSRTANASFVPRLLSMGPSMSASVYRGL